MFNKAAEVTPFVYKSPNDQGGDHKYNQLNEGMLTTHHISNIQKHNRKQKA